MTIDPAGRARSRRPGHRRWLWDLFSSQDEAASRMQAPVRQVAARRLDLRPGQAVLDVGCGTGGHFEMLRERVGPEGRVLGVDFSPKMVGRAERRIERHGWPNVEVRCRDVTTDALDPDTFDAALATFSLSATSDVAAAVDNVYQSLRPGGRLFVCDLRLIPEGRATAAIWLAGQCYRRIAGWTQQDLLDELRATFDEVEVVGTLRPWPPVFMALATKSVTESSPTV